MRLHRHGLLALAWLSITAAGCGARTVGLFDEGDGAGGSAQGAGGAGANGANGANGATGVGGASTGSLTGVTSGAVTGSGPGSGPGSTGSGPGAGPGSTGSGPGAGPGSTGSGGKVCPSFGDPCTDCLSTDCPELYCACVDNPACIAYIQCDNGCGNDAACQTACMAKHEAGISDAILLSGCGGEACPGPCAGSEPIDPCSACILENCEDEANACLAEPSCLALYYCLSDCPPLGLMCQQQCYADHAAGVNLLEDMLTCAENPCAGPCN